MLPVFKKESEETLDPQEFKNDENRDENAGEQQKDDGDDLVQQLLKNYESETSPLDCIVQRGSVDTRYGWIFNVLRDSFRCDGVVDNRCSQL